MDSDWRRDLSHLGAAAPGSTAERHGSKMVIHHKEPDHSTPTFDLDNSEAVAAVEEKSEIILLNLTVEKGPNRWHYRKVVQALRGIPPHIDLLGRYNELRETIDTYLTRLLQTNEMLFDSIVEELEKIDDNWNDVADRAFFGDLQEEPTRIEGPGPQGLRMNPSPDLIDVTDDDGQQVKKSSFQPIVRQETPVEEAQKIAKPVPRKPTKSVGGTGVAGAQGKGYHDDEETNDIVRRVREETERELRAVPEPNVGSQRETREQFYNRLQKYVIEEVRKYKQHAAQEIESQQKPITNQRNVNVAEENFRRFRQIDWPPNWKISPEDCNSSTMKELRNQKLIFDGQAISYKNFRRYFRQMVHSNVILTVSQKTMLLQEMLSEGARSYVGVEYTNDPLIYREYLLTLDEAFDRQNTDAYLRQLDAIPRFEGDDNSLLELRSFLQKAKRGVPVESEAVFVTRCIQKLGRMATTFSAIYPHAEDQTLEALAEFVANQWRVMQRINAQKDIRAARPRYEAPDQRTFVAARSPNRDYEYFSLNDAEGEESIGLAQIASQESAQDRVRICVFCQASHGLQDCEFFAYELSLSQRRQFLESENMCVQCLSPYHQSDACPKTCERNCDQCYSSTHHTLLHEEEQGRAGTDTPDYVSNLAAQTGDYYYFVNKDNKLYKGPIKGGRVTTNQGVIRVRSPFLQEKSRIINVLFDSGANASFFDRSIAEDFGMQGPEKPVRVVGWAGIPRNMMVQLGPLIIEDLQGTLSEKIPAKFCRDPSSGMKFSDWREDLKKFPEFKVVDLPQPYIDENGNSEIHAVLGNDLKFLWKLDVEHKGPIQIGIGKYLTPVAEKNRLCWTIGGFNDPRTPKLQELLDGNVVLNGSIAKVDGEQDSSKLQLIQSAEGTGDRSRLSSGTPQNNPGGRRPQQGETLAESNIQTAHGSIPKGAGSLGEGPNKGPEQTRPDVMESILDKKDTRKSNRVYSDPTESLEQCLTGEGNSSSEFSPKGRVNETSERGALGLKRAERVELEEFGKREEYTKEGKKLELCKKIKEIVGSTYKEKDQENVEVGILWESQKPKLPDNYQECCDRLKKESVNKDLNKLLAQAVAQGQLKQLPDTESNRKGFFIRPFRQEWCDRIRWNVWEKFGENQVGLNDEISTGNELLYDPKPLLKARTLPYMIASQVDLSELEFSMIKRDQRRVKAMWLESKSKPLKIFNLKTRPHELGDHDLLATQHIRLKATACAHSFPQVSQTVLGGMYGNIIIDARNTQEEADELSIQLSRFLSEQCGLQSECKFTSYSPQDCLTRRGELVIKGTKDNGFLYDTTKDEFFFRNKPSGIEEWTKEDLVMTMANLKDPLGLIVPFKVGGQIIIRNLSVEHRHQDWQTRIGDDKLDAFIKWRQDFKLLETLRIPRCVSDVGVTDLQVELGQENRELHSSSRFHVFVDASKDAYGACIYQVSTKTTRGTVRNLVMARSRVTPEEAPTIPRLELNAALIGVHLARDFAKALGLDIKRFDIDHRLFTFWSDSTISLFWIKTDRQKDIYVENRIHEIRNLSDPGQWRHCPGTINPADIASRGETDVAKLRSSKLWWEGPDFLSLSEDQWPENIKEKDLLLKNELDLEETIIDQDDDQDSAEEH